MSSPTAPKRVPLKTLRQLKVNKKLLKPMAHSTGADSPQEIARRMKAHEIVQGMNEPNIVNNKGLLGSMPLPTFRERQGPNNTAKGGIKMKIPSLGIEKFTGACKAVES